MIVWNSFPKVVYSFILDILETDIVFLVVFFVLVNLAVIEASKYM